METNIQQKSASACREEKLGITSEFLKSIFDYKDGKLYWKIKCRSDMPIGSEAGYVRKNKGNLHRHVIKIKDSAFLRSRLVFIYHHGYSPIEVDHQDRNSLNDRIENLREANRLENSRNKNKSKRGKTSKYIGVYWTDGIQNKVYKNGTKQTFAYGRWVSCIRVDGKLIQLGLFKIEEDAALAYNRAAVKYFKEFANLNIIKPLLS